MQESIPYLLLYKIAQLFVVMMIVFALVKFHVVKPKHSVAINIMTTLVACITMPLLVVLYQAI